MKSGLIVLSLAAVLLASCDRKADAPAAPAPAGPAAPTTERAASVRWNPTAGAFEMGGAALRTAKVWTFDGSTDGFTGVGSQLAPADGQGLAVTIADPTVRSPSGLAIPGGQYPLVIVRLTRVGGGEGWDGALYYSTAAHGEGIGWLGKPIDNEAPKLNETVTLVYDMSRQAQGGPDWTQSVIDQIRLDIEDKPGGRFVIHQVAIAENPNPPPADPAAAAAATPPAGTPTPAPKP
ncbi:hypothetical protein [Phenylobacterium sp.]|uniref:hypothetical protein n=1 Tax=Phenylobacterium sp. TaxID=1871053 RepID=UPI002CD26C75|nr:hypothetical protein [Phenylobacterium sp.]HVI30640.1 hypothetical protein [Phenylobacterium sp.]